MLGLPALWTLTATVVRLPVVARALTWIGERSLSLLVAQDFVRFVVGTLLVRAIRVQSWFWMALPVYLVVTLLVTRAWHPVPEWCWRRLHADLQRVAREAALPDRGRAGRLTRPATGQPFPPPGARLV